jgi:hypothetical protein
MGRKKEEERRKTKEGRTRGLGVGGNKEERE